MIDLFHRHANINGVFSSAFPNFLFRFFIKVIAPFSFPIKKNEGAVDLEQPQRKSSKPT